MTRRELHDRLAKCVKNELGRSPYLEIEASDLSPELLQAAVREGTPLIWVNSDEPRPASLQVALDCTSLELTSIQMGIEDEFGLKFGTGPADRGPMDEEWDKLRDVVDLEKFIEKWTKEPS